MGALLWGSDLPIQLTTDCDVCGALIDWVCCPTGGWWTHRIHPTGHDAASRAEAIEEIDERGFYETVGVRTAA